jgi:hypothetical protein
MLTAVGHVGSHLIAAAIACRGPTNDSPQFAPAMRQAAQHIRFDVVLADAGYDAEHNHRLCREELGARSTAIPINPRGAGDRLPRTRYRRQMRRAFPKKAYASRRHAESIFSAMKRTLGSALCARGPEAQKRECLWRVIAFDLMIIRRAG